MMCICKTRFGYGTYAQSYRLHPLHCQFCSVPTSWASRWKISLCCGLCMHAHILSRDVGFDPRYLRNSAAYSLGECRHWYKITYCKLTGTICMLLRWLDVPEIWSFWLQPLAAQCGYCDMQVFYPPPGSASCPHFLYELM